MARTVQELMTLVEDFPAAIYVSGIMVYQGLDPVRNDQGEPLTQDEILTAIENADWETEESRKRQARFDEWKESHV